MRHSGAVACGGMLVAYSILVACSVLPYYPLLSLAAPVYVCTHTENERTVKAAAALEKGDLAGMGKLMSLSHISMRDDFEVRMPACTARGACSTTKAASLATPPCACSVLFRFCPRLPSWIEQNPLA